MIFDPSRKMFLNRCKSFGLFSHLETFEEFRIFDDIVISEKIVFEIVNITNGV